MARLSFSLLLALCVGCGLSTEPAPPAVDKTTEALCSDAPRINANGTATRVGCSFEQHVDNVLHQGTRLSAGAILEDGNGLSVKASNLCGDWVLGLDPQGVEVMVRKSTAEVQSHGMIHPGFDRSTLPTTLELPLVIQ